MKKIRSKVAVLLFLNMFGSVIAVCDDSVVQKMERAQDAVSIPNRVKRDYKLSHANSMKIDSEVIANVNFNAPGGYTLEKLDNNNGAWIVKKALDPEVAIAISVEKSKTVAVTRENYTFEDLGDSPLDGQPYFIFRITPKRKQTELILGQVWIDKKTLLIRRVEGTMKPPSIWVKKIHVKLDFDSSEGVWVLSDMEAIAEIRFIGVRKLTAHLMSYKK